jgi:AraC family transcriptional regulator
MKTSSRAEYLKRLDRVVARLSESIDREATLPSTADLAALAHFSEFHFMRIYRALAGESLGATIQRLRLELAVQLLKSTDQPVAAIAARVGYETPQAFAKAFRQYFDIAPSDVRERPDATPVRSRRAESQAHKPPVVRIEVVELQPFRAAALRNIGDYADLDRAYRALFDWLTDRGGLESIEGIWGSPHDDRRDAVPESSVFDCYLATQAGLSAEGAIQLTTLQGGRYVMHRHVGAYELLDDIHDALFTHVIESDELKLRDAPVLHRYINDPDSVAPEALETEVCVPVHATGGA